MECWQAQGDWEQGVAWRVPGQAWHGLRAGSAPEKPIILYATASLLHVCTIVSFSGRFASVQFFLSASYGWQLIVIVASPCYTNWVRIVLWTIHDQR